MSKTKKIKTALLKLLKHMGTTPTSETTIMEKQIRKQIQELLDTEAAKLKHFQINGSLIREIDLTTDESATLCKFDWRINKILFLKKSSKEGGGNIVVEMNVSANFGTDIAKLFDEAFDKKMKEKTSLENKMINEIFENL